MMKAVISIPGPVLLVVLLSTPVYAAPRNAAGTDPASARLMTEVNRDTARMTSIYQSLYALLMQSLAIEADTMDQVHFGAKEAFDAARKAMDAKNEEIRQKREAAADQFISACAVAVAQAVASIAGQIPSDTMGLPPGFGKEYLLGYKRHTKYTLDRFETLEETVNKLTKNQNGHPYPPEQKDRVRLLSEKVENLKQQLARLKRQNHLFSTTLQTPQ